MLCSRRQLDHITNRVLVGIHDILLANANDVNSPISLKKLKKYEVIWAIQKDMLDFYFDSNKKTMWLNNEKYSTLLTMMK